MAYTSAQRDAVKGKWLPAEKLHVTLVFLGNATAERVEALRPTLDSLAELAPFSLRLEGAGTFVTARAPSVLWLGVGGELSALAALQTEAMRRLEVTPTQTWVPHLTLARAHTDGALTPVAESAHGFVSASFEVRELVLFESTHHHFKKLHVVPLRAPVR